jgi:hypothetical protein
MRDEIYAKVGNEMRRELCKMSEEANEPLSVTIRRVLQAGIDRHKELQTI